MLRAYADGRRDFRNVVIDGEFLHALNLADCDFTGATIRKSLIQKSRFVNCTFDESQLHETGISLTSFIDSAIADLCDTNDVVFESRCVVDWATIARSLQAIHLSHFLVRTGMPELVAGYLIDCAKALDPRMLFGLMRSTFISYGSPDAPFARTLRDALHRNGVQTFFFETDAIPGRRLHHAMRDGVNEYDRVILICSADSLNRPGVLNEIEQALARESRDAGQTCLIPVILDDYLFCWAPADRPRLGQDLAERVVADFRGTAADQTKFNSALMRLLVALRQ